MSIQEGFRKAGQAIRSNPMPVALVGGSSALGVAGVLQEMVVDAAVEWAENPWPSLLNPVACHYESCTTKSLWSQSERSDKRRSSNPKVLLPRSWISNTGVGAVSVSEETLICKIPSSKRISFLVPVKSDEPIKTKSSAIADKSILSPSDALKPVMIWWEADRSILFS